MSVREYAILFTGARLAGGSGAIGLGGTVILDGPPHALGGAEHTGQLPIERISTAETDTALVAAPNGWGGVGFRAETGGGTGYVTNTLGGKEVVDTIAALDWPTHTLDLANGNVFDATLTAACTLAFTGATAGVACSFSLLLRQDGTGGWVTTWPGSVVWPGGSAPTLDTTASTASVLTFFTLDGGTVWYGFPTGGTSSSVFSVTDGVTTVNPTTELTFVGATLTDLGGGNAEVAVSPAAYVDPATATAGAIATALIAAGLMAAS